MLAWLVLPLVNVYRHSINGSRDRGMVEPELRSAQKQLLDRSRC